MTTKTSSPLGNLREEIDRYGHGHFLESAKGLPFYREKLELLQPLVNRGLTCVQACITDGGFFVTSTFVPNIATQLENDGQDYELHLTFIALSTLTYSEIQQWRHQLRAYHSKLQ